MSRFLIAALAALLMLVVAPAAANAAATVTVSVGQTEVVAPTTQPYSFSLSFDSTPDRYTVAIVKPDGALYESKKTVSITGQHAPVNGDGTIALPTNADEGYWTVKVEYFAQGQPAWEARAQKVFRVTRPTPPPPVQCPNGTTVPAGQTCPVIPPPVQCPNGTTVPAGQTCPVIPPPPTPQPEPTPTAYVCPSGALVAAPAACPVPQQQTTIPPQSSTATPVIGLVKRAGKRVVKAGRTVVFTLKVKNVGTVVARNVKVCDAIPARMTVTKLGKGRFENGKLCFSVGTLAVNASTSIKVTMRVDADAPRGTIVNRAVATADGARTVKATAKVKVQKTPRARTAAPVTG